MRHVMRFVLALTAFLPTTATAQPRPVSPPREFPDPVPDSFAGSRDYARSGLGLDSVLFVVPRAKAVGTGLQVEGQRSWTVYQGPSGTSGFAVFIHYKRELTERGYTIVYTCSRKACPYNLMSAGMGGLLNPIVSAMGSAGDGSVDDTHYIVARRLTPNGTDYARIAVRGPTLPVASVDIVSSDQPRAPR